jgi:hypothetical protein
VLVAAKRIELTRRGERVKAIQSIERVVERRAGAKPSPMWRGVVRTPLSPMP